MTIDEKEIPAPADAPIGELVTRLSDDTVRLVRDEIRLAQAEMTQKAKAAGVGAGLLGGSGVFAVYGRYSYSAEPCVQMNDCASIMSRGPRSAWSPRMRRAKSSRLE